MFSKIVIVFSKDLQRIISQTKGFTIGTLACALGIPGLVMLKLCNPKSFPPISNPFENWPTDTENCLERKLIAGIFPQTKRVCLFIETASKFNPSIFDTNPELDVTLDFFKANKKEPFYQMRFRIYVSGSEMHIIYLSK